MIKYCQLFSEGEKRAMDVRLGCALDPSNDPKRKKDNGGER